MRDGRERVGTGARRLDRIRAHLAMDPEDALGLRIVRLELLVRDRPRGRYAILGLEHTEVLAAEARQGGAVDLGVAADAVPEGRPEQLALAVQEALGRAVALVPENGGRAPVLGLARENAASLEDEHLGALVAERVGEGAPAHPAADDDDICRDGGDACLGGHREINLSASRSSARE
jgi:hypothetical protein